MFLDMKIQYAATLLGCLAFLMIPVPILFWFYGPKLRAKSKWAPKIPPPPPKVDVDIKEKEKELEHGDSSANSETL